MSSKYHISPFRHVLDSLLGWFGHGPRHSRFSPARDHDSRVRFAQYMRRVQPPPDRVAVKRKAEMLGRGGALSSGLVRHAAANSELPARRTPSFGAFSPVGSVAARRRFASVQQTSSPLRSMLNALRLR